MIVANAYTQHNYQPGWNKVIDTGGGGGGHHPKWHSLYLKRNDRLLFFFLFGKEINLPIQIRLNKENVLARAICGAVEFFAAFI